MENSQLYLVFIVRARFGSVSFIMLLSIFSLLPSRSAMYRGGEAFIMSYSLLWRHNYCVAYGWYIFKLP